MRSRKKIIAQLIGVFVGLALFLWGTGMALVILYEKEVNAYFLAQLNERLNAKVEIKEVQFSLFQHFPQASIRLIQVKAGHAQFKAPGHLLDVGHIDLTFSLFALWNGNYAIRNVEIADGKLQLFTDREGNTNFNLFKPASGNDDEAFSLSIDQIVGRNLDFIYKDEKNNIEAIGHSEATELSGLFSAREYQLDITADMQMDVFRSAEVVWIKKRPVGLDFSLNVSKPQKTYSFKEGTLRIAELELGVEGIYSDTNPGKYQFRLNGMNLDVNTTLSLLPEKYQESVKNYTGTGKFYGEAWIRQADHPGGEPDIKAEFGVENGTVTHKPSGVELRSLNLKGNLADNQLKLTGVNMLLKGQKISGWCTLSDLSNPRISLKTDAVLNLADLGAFLDLKQFEDLRGMAELHLDLKTSATALKTGTSIADQYLASGNLLIKNASFRLKGDTLHFKEINGNCAFRDANLEVSQISMKTARSDFSFSGSFQNLLGWLLEDGQSLNMSLSAKAKMIFLDEFFQRKTQNAAENDYKFLLSPRVQVSMNAQVDRLQFRKFSAKAIKGEFQVNKQKLIARQLQFQTMGGTVNMLGEVNAQFEDRLEYLCEAKLKAVNIQQLFTECENFGQETIQDKNLRGRMDADLLFNAKGTPALDIIPASVECTADITINNGELIGFEPLNVLSRYISVSELQHIRFSRLQNQIRISKRTIYFPTMDIASSAISISGSGTHTFDNVIDYHIRVRLSDILAGKARKAKKENDEFGELAEDGSGGLNLFLTMKGPIDKPRMSYDTKGAREKRRDDIRKEKQNLRNLFKEEFGKGGKDTSDSKPLQKRKPAIILDFDE